MDRLRAFLYLALAFGWTVLLWAFPVRVWGGYSVSVEVQEDGKVFSIRSTGREHKYGEEIVIDFEVKNRSDKKFFIFDLDEKRKYTANVDEANKSIYCWFGGDFDAEFNTYYKLRLVDIGDSLKFKIVIKTDQLKQTKWDRKGYDFYIDMGYLDFNQDLIYLTQIEPFRGDLVELRNKDDIYKLASLHRGVFIGELPIIMVK